MSKGDQAQPSPRDRTRKESEVQVAEEAGMVQRAMEGDESAFTALYEACLDSVYRYIYRRVESVFEAESLTSETFTRAVDLLAKGHYESQGKPFTAWLIGIAFKILQERYRVLKSTPVLEDLNDILERNELVSGEDDILESIVQQEEYDALWQLVGELPVMDRSVIILRHVYGLSYAQIAERLGSSEHACKQRHYRALKQLRLKAQEADLWGDISRGLLEGRNNPYNSMTK